jgi:glycerol kinase
MQFQSDILNLPVVRPVTRDATALGSAYAAGLAVGYFKDLDDLCSNWAIDHIWKPSMTEAKRKEMYCFWKLAVSKSFDWVTQESC